MPRRTAVLLTPLRSISNSSLFLALSREGIALLHQSESHPLPFQPLAHSLCVYPGWHPDRSSISTGFALVRDHGTRSTGPRVYPEPRRAANSFIGNTYKKHGVGGMLANSPSVSILPVRACVRKARATIARGTSGTPLAFTAPYRRRTLRK